jgi:peptidyl-prolyl cis-trans isomerase B (cyclophilin B)
MKSLVAAGVIAGGLVLTGCGSSSSGGGASVNSQTTPTLSPTPTPTPTATAQPSADCTTPPAVTSSPQTDKYSKEPKLTVARTTYTAKIATNCGTITVALNGKKAPHTVNSFAFLASKGYFTDTPCHRLTTSGIYVLQCGDPTGTGTGGPGYTIPDENLKGATYPAGTVAMANTGSPHTGGSQFFFVYAATPLTADYTPFGTVNAAGVKILQDIAKAGSDDSHGPGDGKPNQPVVIEKFTVTKG